MTALEADWAMDRREPPAESARAVWLHTCGDVTRLTAERVELCPTCGAPMGDLESGCKMNRPHWLMWRTPMEVG